MSKLWGYSDDKTKVDNIIIMFIGFAVNAYDLFTFLENLAKKKI
jgi:hypothetical protein